MLFAFRLCLQLGISDPIKWMDEHPHWLLNAWMAYYMVEPWEVGVNPDEEKDAKKVSPSVALKQFQTQVG